MVVNAEAVVSAINRSFTELISELQADNLKLRQQMKILAVEMGVITDWVTRTTGLEVLNRESEMYKRLHEADEESAEIARQLTIIAAYGGSSPDADADGDNGEHGQMPTIATDGIAGCRRQEPHEVYFGIPVPPMKNLVIRLRRLEDESHQHHFVGEVSANKREENANRRTTCKFCHKKLVSYSVRKAHERMRTGEKPFKCQICESSFGSKSTLVMHMRTHTKERPYKCPTCKKAFTQSANLGLHRRIHLKQNPYTCAHYGSRFNQLAAKQKHEMIHTGEKPFRCSFCDKAFGYRPGMELHVRRHTKERPYKCGRCERSFYSRNGLTKHELAGTGSRFACRYCCSRFNTGLGRRHHEKTVHAGKHAQEHL